MKSAAPPLQGALIGCGFVSRFHVEAWAKVLEARLAALCDLDRPRLEQASARVPGARLYTDATPLFESKQALDFVEICTRPDAHRALAELAARSGVHVLCQKPAAAVRTDLEAVIEACDSSAVRLMFHENWRFRPWYRAPRAELDAGRRPGLHRRLRRNPAAFHHGPDQRRRSRDPRQRHPTHHGRRLDSLPLGRARTHPGSLRVRFTGQGGGDIIRYIWTVISCTV